MSCIISTEGVWLKRMSLVKYQNELIGIVCDNVWKPPMITRYNTFFLNNIPSAKDVEFLRNYTVLRFKKESGKFLTIECNLIKCHGINRVRIDK